MFLAAISLKRDTKEVSYVRAAKNIKVVWGKNFPTFGGEQRFLKAFVSLSDRRGFAPSYGASVKKHPRYVIDTQTPFFVY